MMHKNEDIRKRVEEISEMQTEIIHYKRHYFQAYKGIIPFVIDHYSKVISLKPGWHASKGNAFLNLNQIQKPSVGIVITCSGCW